MESLFPPFHWTKLLIIPGLLIGYTVHELGHAFTAYFLGDTSQVERGKITLNPFEHLSWFGTVSFLIFGIGWPKPMQTNPYHFKRRYLDLFLVAISGPIASFTFTLMGLLLTLSTAAVVVQASGTSTDQVLTILFPPQTDLPETLGPQAWARALTISVTTTSFWLTFTSLLPLPGLDGFAAIASLFAFFRERRVQERTNPISQSVSSSSPVMPMKQRKRRNNAADIHFKIGVEYHQDQKYDDAIARYRQATANDRNFGPAYVNMGLAYLAKSKRKEAIRAFRGAIQFADDQKARTEAWHQLHQLSEVSPIDQPTAEESMAEMGASPWTDTKPRPNWLKLAILTAVLLIAVVVLYGYLLTELIATFKT